MTEIERKLWTRLIRYSETYEISVQLWPTQKTIHIAKDSVELFSCSYGPADLEDALIKALSYLDRITKAKYNV